MSDSIRAYVLKSFEGGEGYVGHELLQELQGLYSMYLASMNASYARMYKENGDGEAPDEEELLVMRAITNSVGITALITLISQVAHTCICNHFGIHQGDKRYREIQDRLPELCKRLSEDITTFLESEGIPRDEESS